MPLTQRDFYEIEKIVDEKIEEKTRNLPTKNEFFNKMDEVIKELKAIREEEPILNNRIINHENRIEKIEEKIKIKPSIV